MSFQNLSAIPDAELLGKIKSLKGEENRIIAEIVLHLSEIDRRGIYRDAGYSSLFTYCCEALGYSEGAAMRRIKVARLLSESPEIYELVRDGKVSLSALTEVTPVIKAENREQVLSMVTGASKREATKIAAQFGATCAPKKACIRVKKVELRTAEEDLFSAVSERSPEPARPQVEERYSFSFEGSKEFASLFEEAKALIGHCAVEEVFEKALREFVSKHKRVPTQRKPSGDEEKSAPGSHSIPKSVRRRVFERDEGRCTFVSADGVRCTACHSLQVDHIEPVARGGSNDLSNLRLLCPAHNQLSAEKWFGRDYTESRRAESRACRSGVVDEFVAHSPAAVTWPHLSPPAGIQQSFSTVS